MTTLRNRRESGNTSISNSLSTSNGSVSAAGLSWSTLPDEILLQIFLNIGAEHWKSVMTCDRVCRSWHRVSQDSIFWESRYLIDFVESELLFGRKVTDECRFRMSKRRVSWTVNCEQDALADEEEDYESPVEWDEGDMLTGKWSSQKLSPSSSRNIDVDLGDNVKENRSHTNATPVVNRLNNSASELPVQSQLPSASVRRELFPPELTVTNQWLLAQQEKEVKAAMVEALRPRLSERAKLFGSWKEMYRETILLCRERACFPELDPNYWADASSLNSEDVLETKATKMPHWPHPAVTILFPRNAVFTRAIEPSKPSDMRTVTATGTVKLDSLVEIDPNAASEISARGAHVEELSSDGVVRRKSTVDGMHTEDAVALSPRVANNTATANAENSAIAVTVEHSVRGYLDSLDIPVLPHRSWKSMTWLDVMKLFIPEVFFRQHPHRYYRPIFEPHLRKSHLVVENPVNYLRAAHCFFFRPYWFFTLFVLGNEPAYLNSYMNAFMLQLLSPWVLILHFLTVFTLVLMLITDAISSDSLVWYLFGFERTTEWSGVFLIAMFNSFVTPLIPLAVLRPRKEPYVNVFLRYFALSLGIIETLLAFGWGVGVVVALVRFTLGIIVVASALYATVRWVAFVSSGFHNWTLERVVYLLMGEIIVFVIASFFIWNELRLWVGLGLGWVFVTVFVPFVITQSWMNTNRRWSSESCLKMLLWCYFPVTFLGVQFVGSCIVFVAYSMVVVENTLHEKTMFF